LFDWFALPMAVSPFVTGAHPKFQLLRRLPTKEGIEWWLNAGRWSASTEKGSQFWWVKLTLEEVPKNNRLAFDACIPLDARIVNLSPLRTTARMHKKQPK
jgi:hypothetical protein